MLILNLIKKICYIVNIINFFLIQILKHVVYCADNAGEGKLQFNF